MSTYGFGPMEEAIEILLSASWLGGGKHKSTVKTLTLLQVAPLPGKHKREA